MLDCITFAIVTAAETRRRSSPPNNHLPGSEHFIMIQRGYFMEEKITFNQETGQIYWSLETQRAGCGTFSGGHKSSAGSAASFRGVTKPSARGAASLWKGPRDDQKVPEQNFIIRIS